MGNKLLFLDILINNNENFQTSVFHKKMYTGLLMNYFSFVPNSYNYGSIKHQLKLKNFVKDFAKMPKLN